MRMQAKRIIYPNALNPFQSPGVSCGGAPQDLILRLFNGSSCSLWDGSGSSCFWDAATQTFQGATCVTSPTTQARERRT